MLNDMVVMFYEKKQQVFYEYPIGIYEKLYS